MLTVQETPADEVAKPKKVTALAKRQSDVPAATVAMTPMEMLNSAIERGADMALLERLMDLQERWEANQARKAFDEAIAAAKAEIKPVTRNAKGHNNKMYADFSAIAKVVDPVLGAHGLSYRFRSEQIDGKITVTCRVAHKAGHAEETCLVGPPDSTGNKNAIQAIGSTLTYLQRYSLVLMLGLAAANDDDGKAAGTPVEDGPISDEQLQELIDLADEVGADKAKFCAFYKIDGFAEIQKSQFVAAKARLNEKRSRS